MAGSNESEAVHLLLFPFPAQGHMLAMLDLTHQLSLRDFQITILVTPKNLSILQPLLSNHPSIQTLVLPFPDHPSLPAGVENVRDVGNSGNIPIINALSKLHDPIIQWFNTHPNPPVAILSDFFLGWTQPLANQLGIPRICFCSIRAFLISVLNFLARNDSAALRSLPAVHFPDLPRSPTFTAEHLPSIFRLWGRPGSDNQFVKESMIANMSSWGFVFNTFETMENEYLNHVKKETGHGRVWGIGPLNSTAGVQITGRANNPVLEWLDQCPDGSVLYICFGSQKHLKKDQMEALANALELSMIRFIWVVKPSGYGSVPDGFEDRVSGRGQVIQGWAPQTKILAHRAVIGFLSHCGWNSVLEAVEAGVVIFAWPMEADQFVNARLLIEDMGVAVSVCEGADAVPDPIELSRTLSESINGDIVQRERAKKLKDEALEAVKVGGSSWRNLESLVKKLKQPMN